MTEAATSLDRRRAAALMAAALAAPTTLGDPAPSPTPQPSPEEGPLATDSRLARLLTPVFVEEQGPFGFIIDTGANRSVLAAELASALGLPPGAGARVHGIAGVKEVATVRAVRLRAGPLQKALGETPLLARSHMGADGILGLDLLRGRRIVFDFARGRVRIERGGGGRASDWFHAGAAATDVVVKARQRSGQLTIVDADILGAAIHCFIDSGAERSVGNLAMRRLVRRRGGDRNFTPIPVIIRGATGQALAAEVAPAPSLRIGGLRYDPFFLAYADLHTFALWNLGDKPALLMGMDLLRSFDAVAVDFGAREVRFRVPDSIRRDLG